MFRTSGGSAGGLPLPNLCPSTNSAIGDNETSKGSVTQSLETEREMLT
jgi:hypothetical protein